MYNENTTQRFIQDIRYAGEHPLLQYDVLDSRILLRMIHTQPHLPMVHPWGLARILKGMEMHPVGLHSICGQLCVLWTSLPYQPRASIVALTRKRMEEGAVDLGTQLVINDEPLPVIPPTPRLSEYDRDVLTLRLKPQGLRYPRPREIAATLQCPVAMVYLALQKIRRELRLKTLKEPAKFRHAAQMAGLHPLTMEDF